MKPQTDDSLRWQLTGDDYSDGASIYQLLSRGPWGDFQRVVAVIGSSLVTPLRPRDYDIEAIQQVAQAITEGKQGLLLRLFAYLCFLDQGKTFEAGQALTEAEAIYHRCASDIPAELHTEFVFGNAYVRRDAASARDWWNRMAAKKPTRLNEDYWRAYSALHWIEGHLKEANEAWDKCNVLAEQLPKAGAYEFDRYFCSLLRKALSPKTKVQNYAIPLFDLSEVCSLEHNWRKIAIALIDGVLSVMAWRWRHRP